MAVQYDKDGVTLFYIDSAGKRVSAGVMDVVRYGAMEAAMDKQMQATRENTIAKANYELAVSNAQISVDAGHTMPAPLKPLMKVVSDTGDETYAPFDPPLKDLVPASASRPAPSGSIKVETVDKQAIMYNMISAMFRRMFPDA